jgi:hypothetical protein
MARFILALLLLSLPLVSAASQQPDLELVAEDGRVTRISVMELASLPQVTVASVDRDSTPIALTGPSFRSLLDLVGAPGGHDLRGPRLMLAVVAEAADGYRVLFTLAEVDPAFGGTTAIVALAQDGGPLPAAEGPMRVVVAGDQHFSRWVRQVVRLRVLRVSP